MKDIPDKSVDMILCDLPYGTTACKWDVIIPFEPLWKQYKRIIKDHGVICLFGSQPFTSTLITSNIKMFKEELIWEKDRASNFAQAKRRHLKYHENIIIFANTKYTYNKQMQIRESPRVKQMIKNGNLNFRGKESRQEAKENQTEIVFATHYEPRSFEVYDPELKNPSTIIKYPIVNSNSKEKTIHPTQKPVALFEYLIKTYTQPGEIVLDNCIGSGTTAIAALNTGRFFIGIEKEPKYVEIARKRLEQAQAQQSLFV